MVRQIRKRDGSIAQFNETKILEAIWKAVQAVGGIDKSKAEKVAHLVVEEVNSKFGENETPGVEDVQDLVEKMLIKEGHDQTAKAYILYRYEHAKLRKRDLFKKRITFKPYEYPELYEYVNSIRHSYWIHTEFNYTSDIQDFAKNVNDVEKSAIQRSMLAIGQIEIAVKTFWGDVYKKLPKPEIGAVGSTFAESEVRHTDAYAQLLELLGLNEEFAKIKENPMLLDRVNYLDRVIQGASTSDQKEYTKSILLFSLLIEYVSLFSQFLIMMSFNKYRNLFKGISNAVEATSKEEQIHGLFGIEIINILRKEHPEWFDEEFKENIINFCKETFEAEKKVVDWILEKGELDFMPKKTIIEFIKNRYNLSLESIGFKKIFEVDPALIKETDWFEDEILATKHVDFFNKRSINYSKRTQSIGGADLF